MIDRLTGLFSALAPLWEMSLTAAFAAAVVLVLRLILKRRAPRQVICLMWLIVFARLLIPVSLESPVSLVPPVLTEQPAAVQPARQPSSPLQSGVSAPEDPQGVQTPATVPPVLTGTSPAAPVTGSQAPAADTQAPAQAPAAQPFTFPWRAAAAAVWLAGTAVILGYGLISYTALRRKVYDAIRAEDGAWEHPDIRSPFILGVFRPRIYLPAGCSGPARQFILCHERAHLRRRDHLVKPLCWLALAIHWFNPMAWAAFLLMSRDMEVACDQAVLRQLGNGVKADYSATLLSLATGGRFPAPCPLAFGEGDAKSRIRNILSYKKPALWIMIVAVTAAAVTAVCLLTDPASSSAEEDVSPPPSVSQNLPDEPEPLPPANPSTLLATVQKADGSTGGDSVSLSMADGAPLLSWNGAEFRLSESITGESLTGLYYRDLDGDGTAESAVTYALNTNGKDNPVVTVYELSDGQITPYTYDTTEVLQRMMNSVSASYQSDSQTLVFTHTHYDNDARVDRTVQGDGHLDPSYFRNYRDQASELRYFYAYQLSSLTLNGSTFQALVEPFLANHTAIEFPSMMQSDNYVADKPVGRLTYPLVYTGSGFELGEPEIGIYSYDELSDLLLYYKTDTSSEYAAIYSTAAGAYSGTASSAPAYLHWAGAVFPLEGYHLTDIHDIACQDFDGDGQSEVFLVCGNGYEDTALHLLKRNGNQLSWHSEFSLSRLIDRLADPANSYITYSSQDHTVNFVYQETLVASAVYLPTAYGSWQDAWDAMLTAYESGFPGSYLGYSSTRYYVFDAAQPSAISGMQVLPLADGLRLEMLYEVRCDQSGALSAVITGLILMSDYQ